MVLSIKTASHSSVTPSAPLTKMEGADAKGSVAVLSALCIAFTQLAKKMRNLQQQYKLQSEQQALKLQENAYQRDKEAVKKGQTAATISAGTMAAFGAVGLCGAFSKVGAMMKKSHVTKASKQLDEVNKKIIQIKIDQPQQATLTNEEIFAQLKVAPQEKSTGWKFSLNAKKNPLQRYKNFSDLEKQAQNIPGAVHHLGTTGEVLDAIGRSGQPVGQLSSMSTDSEAKMEKVGAERSKGFQQLNEQGMRQNEEGARECSRQLRDVGNNFNELYSKITLAVR